MNRYQDLAVTLVRDGLNNLEDTRLFVDEVEKALDFLRYEGSVAVPRFMNPEGVVVFHEAGRVGFKKTLDNDALPKSLV